MLVIVNDNYLSYKCTCQLISSTPVILKLPSLIQIVVSSMYRYRQLQVGHYIWISMNDITMLPEGWDLYMGFCKVVVSWFISYLCSSKCYETIILSDKRDKSEK